MGKGIATSMMLYQCGLCWHGGRDQVIEVIGHGRDGAVRISLSVVGRRSSKRQVMWYF